MVAAFQEGVRSALHTDRGGIHASPEEQHSRKHANFKPPPCIDGKGARHWLLQLEMYHDLIGMDPSGGSRMLAVTWQAKH